MCKFHEQQRLVPSTMKIQAHPGRPPMPAIWFKPYHIKIPLKRKQMAYRCKKSPETAREL